MGNTCTNFNDIRKCAYYLKFKNNIRYYNLLLS